MSGFLSNLKATIAKSQEGPKPWGDVNPLLLIGLSDTILNLGLDEQQLYSVVKSYGRQLTAQVHPDRQVTNVSEDIRRKIFEGFNAIDDFNHFQIALREFRSLRAEDRRENKILHEALSALRHRVSTFEAEYSKIKQKVLDLEEERQNFLRLKQEEGLKLPDLQRYCEIADKRIDELIKQIESTRKTGNSWRSRFSSAMKYMVSLSGTYKPYKPFFDVQWVAVASLWHNEGEPLTPDDTTWHVLLEQNEDVLSLNIPLETIADQWKPIKSQFGKPEPTEPKSLPISLSILRLDKGTPRLISGDHLTVNGGKVIGSIDGNSYKLTRDNLFQKMDAMEISRLLTPVIVPGGLLVSLSELTGVKAAWSTTCPGYRFHTKRIIVAVG